jgi:hypothetical protein
VDIDTVSRGFCSAPGSVVIYTTRNRLLLSWCVYVQNLLELLLSTVTAGLFFGALAVLAFLSVLFWVCLRYCCGNGGCCPVGCQKSKCGCMGRSRKSSPHFVTQANSGSQDPAPSKASQGGPSRRCGMGVWEAVLVWLTVSLGIVVTALSIWGLAYALPATDSLVPEFWDIVDDMQYRVGRCWDACLAF